MCGIALMATCFVGCKKDKGNTPDGPGSDLPNGFYVNVKGADLIEGNAMEQGINEVDQTAREGMYEKYIVLEGGKEYQFVNKKGAETESWGADLKYADDLLTTDNHEVAGYQGSLAANTSVTVKETGLYHIILDFNADGALDDIGGKQCIIVPVEWTTRGFNEDWNSKAATSVEGYKWTWAEVEITAGGKFKFNHSDAWKINLDIAGLVKANTNLGTDLVAGGADIPTKRGVFTYILEYVGPAATVAESFKYECKLVKELEVADPSKFLVGFSGDAVACGWGDAEHVSPAGDAVAVYDATASNITNPETLAGTYVYNVENVEISAGYFKVRYNGGWYGYQQCEITGMDIPATTETGKDIPAVAGTYSAKFTVEWNGEKETSVKVDFVKK